MAKDIYLYSSRLCPFCTQAKRLLEHKGLAYRELLVDGDPALRQEAMTRSGRRTVPQIWVGDTHVGGCDDLFALERAGALDGLLKSEGLA
jgi:glutaredoxin 3